MGCPRRNAANELAKIARVNGIPDGELAGVCFEIPLRTLATSEALGEMRRVLRPGGRLIITVPHAGWFAWLDSNNIRFRLPGFYQRVVGRGLRDGVYDAIGRSVEWHHHFTLSELLDLAGNGWSSVAVRYGGLVVYPLVDWLSWPFYKLRAPDHRLRRRCIDKPLTTGKQGGPLRLSGKGLSAGLSWWRGPTG